MKIKLYDLFWVVKEKWFLSVCVCVCVCFCVVVFSTKANAPSCISIKFPKINQTQVELTDEVKEVRQSMRNVLVVCKQMHEKINKCIQEDVAEQKRKKDMRILQIVGEFSGELKKGVGVGGEDEAGSSVRQE